MQKKPNTTKKKYRIFQTGDRLSTARLRAGVGDFRRPQVRSKKNLSQIGDAYDNTIEGRAAIIGHILRPGRKFSHAVHYGGQMTTGITYKANYAHRCGLFRYFRS